MVRDESPEPPSDSLVSADLPSHLALSEEVRAHAKQTSGLIAKIQEQVTEARGQVDPEHGMSLLELKNHLMLDYLANLSFVALKKTLGKPLNSDQPDSAVRRIVADRTVLEKLRPMEQKLRYQMDKALKAAKNGGQDVDPNDPMQFKANPQALLSKLAGDDDEDDDDEDDSDDGDEDEAGGDKDKKYKAPKHVPAYYDDDQTREQQAEESAQKEKKRQLSKGLIEELKRQHLDAPEETYDQEDVMRKRQVEAIRERTRYEEDNFVRLPVPKKVKHSRRQQGTMGTIADEVTSFGTSYFSDKSGDGTRKRKAGGRGRKKGGAKKKKFKK